MELILSKLDASLGM